MKCLGIESTAHTLGVGIVEDGEVLSNNKSLYTTEEGGMVPHELSDHHMKEYKQVLKNSLSNADCSMEDIDVIAFSQSPGIGNSLRIGGLLAKSLSLEYDKPLVGVNHLIAHLEIGRHFANASDPVLLLTSGANTQVIAYESEKYRIFGETLDNGVGNFLDKVGREMGLGFPSGPEIERLAKQANNYVKLPYVVKGMDTSFGGLETNLKQKINSGKYAKEDLCYSIQETVFAMLVEITERAMAHTGKDELILGGGVACNKRLQEMCNTMCEDRGADFYCPDNEFLVDNGAMIAHTGLKMYQAGGNEVKPEETTIHPYLRTDEIEVNWR